jgi:hypothetical protein
MADGGWPPRQPPPRSGADSRRGRRADPRPGRACGASSRRGRERSPASSSRAATGRLTPSSRSLPRPGAPAPGSPHAESPRPIHPAARIPSPDHAGVGVRPVRGDGPPPSLEIPSLPTRESRAGDLTRPGLRSASDPPNRASRRHAPKARPGDALYEEMERAAVVVVAMVGLLSVAFSGCARPTRLGRDELSRTRRPYALSDIACELRACRSERTRPRWPDAEKIVKAG